MSQEEGNKAAPSHLAERRSHPKLLKDGLIATRSGHTLSFREYGRRPAEGSSIRPIIYIHGLGGSREEYFGRTSLTLDCTAPSRQQGPRKGLSLASVQNYGQLDPLLLSGREGGDGTGRLSQTHLQELEEDFVYVISISRSGYGESAAMTPEEPLVDVATEAESTTESSSPVPESPEDFQETDPDLDWGTMTRYEVFATQIVDVLTVLGIEGGVSVVGWSSGGPYAMALARFIGGAPLLVQRMAERRRSAESRDLKPDAAALDKASPPEPSRYPFFIQTMHLVASHPAWSQAPGWVHRRAHYQGHLFWLVRNHPGVVKTFWRVVRLLLVRPLLGVFSLLNRLAGAPSSQRPLPEGKTLHPPPNFLRRLFWFGSFVLWERRFRAAFQQGLSGILADMRAERTYWGFQPREIIGVPVTLIHGKKDWLVDHHCSVWLAGQLSLGAPEMRLRLFPQDAHNIMEFRWSQIITDILQQQFQWRSSSRFPAALE